MITALYDDFLMIFSSSIGLWVDNDVDHRQLNYSKTVKWDYIFGDALKWSCPSVRPN
jgi:hypothetical protein